ncbi:heme ABC transporter ATP-binding protein [Pseudorhodoplanes sinuspersici]|uniref:heme ABC transporter ATP-binding protein n=1 Tax=Pseudorhodoplanes sinuspersici TaxID=1235591 RepID=UPI002477D1E5|nr:heme ABC transporter ATP-binding protein [Pseudorhodoplanes sinuspersici]
MIDVAGAGVRVGERTILSGIDLTVGPGEIVALVGPNGAGKSTLLRAISGEVRLAEGKIAIKGRPLTDYSPRELARHRAVLSQHTNVSFDFSVEEIVVMGADSARPQSWVRDVARTAMKQCDILHLFDRPVTRLSGGEQQRVHFARAMLQLLSADDRCKPGLFFLDEPTASLDLNHQLRMVEMVRNITKEGTGILLVIHDLNLMAMLASRVAMMKAGRIIALGPPDEVIRDDVMSDVFAVSNSVRVTPEAPMPFVLPQSMRVRR